MCVFVLACLSGCIKILTCASASVNKLKRRFPPLLLFYSHLPPPTSSPPSPPHPHPTPDHQVPPLPHSLCSLLASCSFNPDPALSSSDPPSPCTSSPLWPSLFPLCHGLHCSHQLLEKLPSFHNNKCIRILVFLLQC